MRALRAGITTPDVTFGCFSGRDLDVYETPLAPHPAA
jgi:hypothetical protein